MNEALDNVWLEIRCTHGEVDSISAFTYEYLGAPTAQYISTDKLRELVEKWRDICEDSGYDSDCQAYDYAASELEALLK